MLLEELDDLIPSDLLQDRYQELYLFGSSS